MFLLITAAALIVAAVVLLAVRAAKWIAGMSALLGLAVLAATFFTQVPTQNVGVVTSFGRTTGKTLSPGLHGKLPWLRVNDMDGTVQLLDNLGEAPNKDVGANGRTAVRLNNNSVMFVDNAFRWKIKPDAAPGLYLDWRKGGGNIVDDNVGPGLVEKELAAAINVALAPYDPYDRTRAGQSNDQLSRAVVERLVGADGNSGRIGTKVEVVSFTILSVNFDEQTQARINNVQEETARTNAAVQREKTAAADARANRTLAGSVSKDPNVLVARCLDNQAKMIEKGQSLLGMPSCWPGGSSGTVLTTPTK